MSNVTASLHPNIHSIQQAIAPLQSRIAQHPLLSTLTTQAAIQQLMTQHVFCVWDFVCLIKTLHGRLSPANAPWFPTQDAASLRLLYELLISEETDQNPGPTPFTYGSHFECYLEAMKACGANRKPIETFLQALKNKAPLHTALNQSHILPTTKQFVQQTFSTFRQPIHIIAASFVFGREAMIPDFFAPWLAQIKQHKIPNCNQLCYYLERHIELDGEDHFPKAAKLLANLCRNDEYAWQQSEQAAKDALHARLKFLTGVHEQVCTTKHKPIKKDEKIS